MEIRKPKCKVCGAEIDIRDLSVSGLCKACEEEKERKKIREGHFR